MASWETSISKELAMVSAVIADQTASKEPLLTEIAHYVLDAGGKKVRPAVAILAFYSVGGREVEDIVEVAAVMELIHNATLLHDDINDGGVLRRGRPAAYTKYGVQSALVTGDFLFAQAFHLGAKFHRNIVDITAETCVRLAEGEIRQEQNTRNLSVTEEDYMGIIRRKTAGPIGAGARVGGILAEGEPEDVLALTEYGLNLGVAFQIVDDILDVVGDSAIMGKPTGTDVKEGNLTLLSQHALRHARSGEAKELAGLIQKRTESPEEMARALEIIVDSGAVDVARERAAAYGERAKERVGLIPKSPQKIELLKLVDFVLTRES